jgi:hypothetical protein
MHNGEMPVYNNVQRTNDMSHAMLSPINRILKRENNIATITIQSYSKEKKVRDKETENFL